MAQTFAVAEISYGAVQRRQPKTTVVSFDEGGYQVRMKRGLNADARTWDVPINAVSIAGANNIENFLAAHGGVDWFWWIAPRETIPRKFICTNWTREPVNGSRTHDKMQLTFQEVFDLS